MSEITAAKVKELREKTGAGMMDAKKALTEAGGDMEAAMEELRKKGMAKADKKSSRTAAEGLVAVVTDGTKGAVIELNAETDFVSRNEEFQAFVKKVAEKALDVENVEALAASDFGGKSVKDALTDLIAKIGENMALRRSEKLEVSNGAIVSYVHGALAEGLGKIGVLVALESDASADVLEPLGKQVAMHVAAAFPKYLDRNSVDTAEMEKERAFLVEQAMAEGKPQEIAEKMVEGRMRKYFEEICLLDQKSVIDGETKIADVIANAAKEAGSKITLTAFSRFQLGEGIEKEEEDFAAEVAKAANG
ncbi:MAG TPA: translation elongation factor Ts [Alphaproteobacteria bacterium]|nr:MAG: elongation factor Ts [Rhodospirillales bacterium]HOO82236.1 translation elongation factor Ts [Alphaproteobacteria bacterium]